MGRHVNGDGNITSETRPVTGFNGIDVSGAMDVYIIQDSVQSVKIETDENLLGYIVTGKENGILRIYPQNNYNLRPSNTIKVYVSGPTFRTLEASGACDFYSGNKITSSDPVSIDLSGSCDAKMELNAPVIKASLSGAGSVTLSGETKDLSVDGSGSSDFKCFDLKAENVDIDISGSGDAQVFASVKLNVSVSGSGDVKYKGDAAVSQKVSGSGSVKKVE